MAGTEIRIMHNSHLHPNRLKISRMVIICRKICLNDSPINCLFSWSNLATMKWTMVVAIIALMSIFTVSAANVDSLILNLKSEKDGLRASAAMSLGMIKDTRSVDPLIQALNDTNSLVRRSAAEALGKIGDAAAVYPLIDTLKDADKGVRRSAAEALGSIGDAKAVDSLVKALKGTDPEVRMAAANSLGLIGDPRAVDPLVQALKNDDDKWVREAAATAIVPVLKNADFETRKKASEYLFGVEATNEAVGALKNEGRLS